MRDSLTKALKYHGDDLCVLTLPYGKKWDRAPWKYLQNRQASRPEILSAFDDGHDHNLAIMHGRASGNSLALDCETPKRYSSMLYILIEMGIHTWCVQRQPNGSAHDGGGHIILRTPVPVQSRNYGDLEVRAQKEYTLAPFSEHPGGGLYYDNHETSSEIFTLPSLTAIPGLPLYEAEPELTPSKFAWKLLGGDPDVLARYASRSEAEAALCLSLVSTGHTYQDVERLLLKYGGPGKFAEMYRASPQNGRRYLLLTWHNAQGYAASHPSEGRRLAAELIERASGRPWPGRTGSTDRAVYLAHLDIVRRCGKNPYAASSRQLAELAGTGSNTACRATRRLIDKHRLLSVVQQGYATLSPRYRLLEPCENVHTGSLFHMGERESDPVCTNGADIFRYRGLGKAAGELYHVLGERGRMTVGELAAVTGRHRTTVVRRLVDLVDAGLVLQCGKNEWELDLEGSLENAAHRAGPDVEGAGARQRQRHETQRALHRLEVYKQGTFR